VRVFDGELFKTVESNVANVGNFNDNNGLNVNDWNADNGNSNVWVSRLVLSSSLAWWILSNHQAFCLFLVKLAEALSIFYLLKLESLLKA
jgi:hypothetical protein